MKNVIVTIVPAQPGWTVLEAVRREGEVIGFYRYPIVAWLVEAYPPEKPGHGDYRTFAFPVTTDEVEDKKITRAPNGNVIIRNEARFDNEAQAIEYLDTRQTA